MRDTIRKIIREQVNDKFFSIISKELDKVNAEFAHSFGMSDESWRLGSEILYKTERNDCIIWGSPEQKVLIDKMAIISDFEDYPKNEVMVYCDIIKRYYNLDTPIPRDDNSIISLLGRKYFVTILDGDAYEYDEHTGAEDDDYLTIGYEYNDYDENNDVGESENDVIWFLKNNFKLNTQDAEEILYKWTYDQINSGKYNG